MQSDLALHDEKDSAGGASKLIARWWVRSISKDDL
jgi:hypothetical protein